MDTNLSGQLTGLQLMGHDPFPSPVLIVMCHGTQASARQLKPLAAAWHAELPHAAFMLPDAPQICRRRFGLRWGRQWFSLKQPREHQAAAALEAAGWLNARVDQELARRDLPPGAVLYCGFSQGAMVALLAGLMRPAAPLGIVSIAGALLARDGSFVPSCRPPVLLVHGTHDAVVPAARSEQAAARLRAAGIPVRLELLPMLGHGIVPDAAPAGAAFIAQLCA